MNPNTKNIEIKLPKGSEAEKINKTNTELRKILEDLGILEKNNPEHPVVKEKKEIKNNTNKKLQKLKDSLGINEDNLPTDEKGNIISPNEVWPEGIPEELNN